MVEKDLVKVLVVGSLTIYSDKDSGWDNLPPLALIKQGEGTSVLQ